MMQRRKYEDYGAKESAAQILSDCVHYGYSDGWCGNGTFNEVEEILEKFNVVYTSDFTGEWKPKPTM